MNSDNKSEFYSAVFWATIATILILLFGYTLGYYAGKEAGVGICYKAQVAK